MRRRESEKRQGGEKGQLVTASGPTGINVRDETDRERERERERDGERIDSARGWKVGSGRAENNAACRITNYTLQRH